MKVNDDLIVYLADLSRLELTDDEKKAREKDLTDILDYMDKLDGLDTEGVPEMSHPFNETNRFREDVVTCEDRRSEMLANAPDSKGDFFKVFKTVDE